MFRSFKIVLFVFISTLSFGQELTEDMKLITSKMDSSASVAIEVKVNVYSNKDASRIYATKASVFKTGKNYRGVLGELEFISTVEYDLRVDHEEKAILIQKKQAEKGKKKKPMEFNIDVDALREFFDTIQKTKTTEVKLVSGKENIKKYQVTGISGMRAVEIELDVKRKIIISISYEYGTSDIPGQYIVLNYTKFEYNRDLSEQFDLSAFFTVKDGQYILNDKIKNYQLYTEL